MKEGKKLVGFGNSAKKELGEEQQGLEKCQLRFLKVSSSLSVISAFY